MLCEKITSYYGSLVDVTNPSDPLGRTVRYSEQEKDVNPGEQMDPVGDILYGCCANGRLIHKYFDRVLLLVTNTCPAHCRFCFRKRIVENSESEITQDELEEAVRYISSRRTIREVILSGGDPLSLSDHRLIEIIEALKIRAGVPSIRVHTRYPVYDPYRCKRFSAVASLVDTFVLHVNHQREITPEFCEVADMLHDHALLLNQSVLLKGVNDSLEELESLSRALASAKILPYYLHYPDVVPGISHFRIPLEDAIKLVDALQGKLSGYLVPRLVLDIPGGKGKVVLSGNPARRLADGRYILKTHDSEEMIEYQEYI